MWAVYLVVSSVVGGCGRRRRVNLLQPVKCWAAAGFCLLAQPHFRICGGDGVVVCGGSFGFGLAAWTVSFSVAGVARCCRLSARACCGVFCLLAFVSGGRISHRDQWLVADRGGPKIG